MAADDCIVPKSERALTTMSAHPGCLVWSSVSNKDDDIVGVGWNPSTRLLGDRVRPVDHLARAFMENRFACVVEKFDRRPTGPW